MFLLLNQLEYKNLVKYECKPIKRVYINQVRADGSTKIRPLGIPTIYDRILQKMVFTVLDPAIDVLSDPNSYGFRKYRNCHMAISKVSKCLIRNPQERMILDFYIKGFFDNLNHKWILDNFPMPKGFLHVLASWLNESILLPKNDYYYPESLDSLTSGVPQGGIISPLIANFTLNGLEKAAFEGCTKSVRKIKKGKNIQTDYSLNLIRYADDFVVITTHPNTDLITHNIAEFLEKRGLYINEDKSKKIDLGRDKATFTFLGYSFSRFDRMKRNIFSGRLDGADNKLMITPDKSKFIAFRKKIKTIINGHLHNSALTLVKALNPVLKGWAQYFGIGTASQILGSVDAYVYKRMEVWMKKKYPKTSVRKLISTYFGCKTAYPVSPFLQKDNSPNLPYSPHGLLWHFHAEMKLTSNKKPYRLWLVKTAYVNKRVPSWIYCANNKILEISPYLDEKPYLEFLSKIRQSRIRPRNNSFDKLYLLQDGLCEWCNEPLNIDSDFDNSFNIHHLIPLNIGGSTNITNLTLLHQECHKDVHKYFGISKITVMNHPRASFELTKAPRRRGNKTRVAMQSP